MKQIINVVVCMAALAAITIGSTFAAVKSCCDTPTCCNGSCCKTKHHLK
jgi:hypothetical protein